MKIDLAAYKEEQMHRRLDSWLIRANMPDWEAYFRFLQTDCVEQDRFRSYLTIHVSEFFRDCDRWEALGRDVIPALLRQKKIFPQPEAGEGARKGLRAWSAGCSIGAEAYTLAMLLEECAPGLPHTVLATDLDRFALKKAHDRGPYHPDEVRNLDSHQQMKYLDRQGQHFFVKLHLAKRVTFRQHNLLDDPFETGFDLIICRNVTIYFKLQAKNDLFKRFQQALRPGGILFLGGTEMITRPADYDLRQKGISFYERV